jgi:hypothetical protein
LTLPPLSILILKAPPPPTPTPEAKPDEEAQKPEVPEVDANPEKTDIVSDKPAA